VALLYADSSALVKLVLDEPESPVLRTYLSGSDLVSCELILTEIPRAVRRAGDRDPRLPLDTLLERTGRLVDAIALLPVDRAILAAAGALTEPVIRALDAIHVTAAVDVGPLDAFITYDERQAAVARLAGLRTLAPGS